MSAKIQRAQPQIVGLAAMKLVEMSKKVDNDIHIENKETEKLMYIVRFLSFVLNI